MTITRNDQVTALLQRLRAEADRNAMQYLDRDDPDAILETGSFTTLRHLLARELLRLHDRHRIDFHEHAQLNVLHQVQEAARAGTMSARDRTLPAPDWTLITLLALAMRQAASARGEHPPMYVLSLMRSRKGLRSPASASTSSRTMGRAFAVRPPKPLKDSWRSYATSRPEPSSWISPAHHARPGRTTAEIVRFASRACNCMGPTPRPRSSGPGFGGPRPPASVAPSQAWAGRPSCPPTWTSGAARLGVGGWTRTSASCSTEARRDGFDRRRMSRRGRFG